MRTLADFPGATITTFQPQWEDGWYPRGPSIALGDPGYAAMIIVGDLWRPVNVPPRPNDGFEARYATPGIIRTRNFFSLLDSELRPHGWVELPTPDAPVLFPHVLGVEEPRLYWKNGRWRFTGAIRQHHESGDANAALCTVGKPHVEIIPVAEGVWMKNLMPSATCLIDSTASRPGLHGGAVVPFEDGFLGVVHEIQAGRRYDQRFARFATDGSLVRLSEPFRFQGVQPLEVAAGIVLHQGDVVVSYGVQDVETYLARFPLESVLEAL